jgi:hypothetical protein
MLGNLDEVEVESASRRNIPTLKPTNNPKSNVIVGRCSRRSRQEDRVVIVGSCRSWRRGNRRCKPQVGKRGTNLHGKMDYIYSQNRLHKNCRNPPQKCNSCAVDFGHDDQIDCTGIAEIQRIFAILVQSILWVDVIYFSDSCVFLYYEKVAIKHHHLDCCEIYTIKSLDFSTSRRRRQFEDQRHRNRTPMWRPASCLRYPNSKTTGRLGHDCSSNTPFWQSVSPHFFHFM